MLRVVAGKYRGRRLETPPGQNTRPTSDKVREGIFNVLSGRMIWQGAHVLDLFAGSGALGLEALSRGAEQALFVESHARTAAVIRKNLQLLQIPAMQAQVKVAQVERYLEKYLQSRPEQSVDYLTGKTEGNTEVNERENKDAEQAHNQAGKTASEATLFTPSLILMDPPYAYGGYERVLTLLSQPGMIAEGAYVVVEGSRDKSLEAPSVLAPVQVKRYGDTQVWFFIKASIKG